MTKYMNNGDEVKITINGSVIETVEKYKYRRVILDTKLDFGLQAEYSIGKAKRASATVCSLITVGVTVGLNCISDAEYSTSSESTQYTLSN